MNKLNHSGLMMRYFAGLLLMVMLSACGGAGSGAGDPEQPLSDDSAQGLGPIAEDPGTVEFVPSTEELGIVYADPTQSDLSNDDFVIEQWIHMQNCMQVSAMEPVVTVVEGKINPIAATDDVVRHIDGMIQASSHVTDTGASIQIRSADFDGSLGKPGSYLRSIMGRYLVTTPQGARTSEPGTPVMENPAAQPAAPNPADANYRPGRGYSSLSENHGNTAGPELRERTYVNGETALKELVKDNLRAGGVCGLAQVLFSVTLKPDGTVVSYRVLAANTEQVKSQIGTLIPNMKFDAIDARYNQTIYQEIKAEIFCEVVEPANP